ncbi:glycosyltransferase [Persicitalea jodogahamensis]|uniref:Glycosyl transferase family 2 n=1 Tax=Persicitalea jodogahamensis TaxID=402147 RepID=A0A8J3D293_9BACT|nr:glycosyltransferase family 2 protein [Persicitalea jodogahamensis]GHB59276.1 glycosyl transferase family 2 [Persicitalea jodogahamensis]
MLITAAIVVYNNDTILLQKAINSFLDTTIDVKLFIIDNSPKDVLRTLVLDSRIKYIFNNKNLGFGKAHNIGISEAKRLNADYHLILNPDVYFARTEFDKIVNFMDANKEFGLLMPKVLYPDGKLQFLCKKSPSISILILRRFMPFFIQKMFKNKLDKYEYRDHNYDTNIIDVPYLSGCFMFFRVNTLSKVNGFDEDIFMYMEDADITLRTLKHSHTIYYSEAYIYHNYEKGSYKNFKLMLYNIHGAVVYFNKWGWKL